MLTPILLDHRGRDGSTLMMRLLRSSPAIAVPGPYPFEKKYFAYLWRWSRMLERQDHSELWTYVDLVSLTYEPGKPLIGPPPWASDLLLGGESSISRQMFDEAWREFSDRAAAQVRSEQGDPAADVRYYAEKHQDTRAVDLAKLPPLKVIVLVRDPRDMFVSFEAFDAKRQAEGGPRFEGAVPAPWESEEDRITHFIDRERDRMRWIAKLDPDGELPVFRYEDLVADLPGQAHWLERWLSVELDPDAATADAELRDRHVSAATTEESVGRWRRELDPQLAERFDRELGGELTALGYEVEAGDRPGAPDRG